MLEKYLRDHYQRIFVEPIVKRMMYWSFLSPSHLTIAGCLIGIVSGISIGIGLMWSSFVLLLLSGYLDTLDGSLARSTNRSSPFGGALDIVSDRVVEFSIILGFYGLHSEVNGVYVVLMLGSILICVTSFLVVGIFTENSTHKSFYYSPGLIERGEAFLFFALMIFFPKAFFLLAVTFISLVFFTAGLRLYQFARYRLA